MQSLVDVPCFLTYVNAIEFAGSFVYYALVKLFYPHPLGHPWKHHSFIGRHALLITLFLPCPALIDHFNFSIFHCPALLHLVFQCPAFFYYIHFPPDLGDARGIGEEQFDWRMRLEYSNMEISWF